MDGWMYGLKPIWVLPLKTLDINHDKLREVLFGFGQLKKNLTPLLCDSFQCSWHFGGKAFKGDECVCCKDVKLMHLDKCLEWQSTNLKNYSSLT
jgi:hypothetical protein